MHRSRKAIVLVIWIVLSVLALVACGTQSAAAPVATSPTVNTQNVRKACEQAVDDGLAAYRAGDFEAAVSLAQEAVTTDPACPGGWELYQLATIAGAADDYLHNLPADRYRITPEQYLEEAEQDYVVVDVREPDEFAAGHIEGAINVPLRSITQQLDDLPADKDAPILLYCRSARRSAHALVILRMLGYTNVYHVRGGFEAYQAYLEERVEPTATATPMPTPTSERSMGGCW